MDNRNPKYKIVKENLNLPPHEIKKELRKLYPDITNEETINLILNVLKESRPEKRLVKTDMKKEKEIDAER